jgi:multimeric flavodoxin WrbA
MHTFAINCSLKPAPEPSSTDRLLDLVEQELSTHDVSMSRSRVGDHAVRPGVTGDEGDGDEWPSLRQQLLDAQLFVLATPIWLGHPSSHAQRVLERLDAFITDTDDRDQMRTVDRVAMVAVVGNEDGAHHVAAELFQGLNDTGFSLAPGAMTYWVGEAMGSIDYKDLDSPPDKVSQTTSMMVANAVHLARQIAASPFPPLG